MSWSPARLAVVFAAIGHFFIHFFAVYYYLVVLPLEREWGRPYHELIELWTVGAFLIGLLAMPAGWIADRWSATGMMVVGFVGLGLASIACGFATSPTALWAGLCLLGAFAAIYHPVGIPWLVRSSRNRGRALGVNGIFGSIGVAGAGLIGGTLIDLWGWRSALVLPGVLSCLTGLAMLYCVWRGWVADAVRPVGTTSPAPRSDRVWTFAILLLTMFGGSLIYQATQAALPKVFALRLAGGLGEGAQGVGLLIAVVYGVAGFSQVAAGHLADRLPLKAVYLTAFLVQVPLLWIAAGLGGPALVALATLMVMFNQGSLPAENLLLAGAVPVRHQSLAFGLKFVLAFSTAPLAIELVAFINERTREFGAVFLMLAGTAAVSLVAAALIPRSRDAVPGAVPAGS